MATSLLDRVFPYRAPTPAKAASGIGMTWMSTDLPVSSVTNNPQKFMAEAQMLGRTNWAIRSCERVIGNHLVNVPWHLEDGDDEEINDTAPEQYQAIRNLLERPYTPAPGDPQTATPQTRSALWRLTSRHMGLCNLAFWYLDQTEALAGTPLQILYINPARMTPEVNSYGALYDWTLDKDARGGGTSMGLKDVLAFYLEPPDSGFTGGGLVEAAITQAELLKLTNRHVTQVTASGGRLPGVLSPKTDGMNDDQFEQLKRDVRTIAEVPDSAKRMLILKGPVDFERTAATVQELDLVNVVDSLGVDPIFGLWNVPKTQIGTALPAGLNSGGAKDVDYEVLWKGAVAPRLDAMWEVIQYQLLDRYKATGTIVELELDRPEFDDRTPLFEQAQIAANAGIPLTQNQKLALIGEEPFPDGDARGDEVWMPGTFARVYPETEKVTPPQLLPFTGQAPGSEPVDPLLPDETEPLEAKAKDERESTAKRMQADVAKVLREAGKQTAGRAAQKHGHLTRKPTDVGAIFDERAFEASMLKALTPYAAQAAKEAAQRPVKAVSKDIYRSLLEKLLVKVGLRIKGMGQSTRDALGITIRNGIDDGLSPAQLGDLIEASTGFNELRAETIARTETGTLLNEAAVGSYREYGVEKVLVYDGEQDDICANADGATWTLDEADAEPLGHPNCVRSFAPIVEFAT